MYANDGKIKKILYLVCRYTLTTRYRKVSIRQISVFLIDPKNGNTRRTERGGRTTAQDGGAAGTMMYSRQHGLPDDCMSGLIFCHRDSAQIFFFYFLTVPRGWGRGQPSLPRCRAGGMLCVPPIWPLGNFMGIRPFFVAAGVVHLICNQGVRV